MHLKCPLLVHHKCPLLMHHKCPLLVHHKCPLLMHHKCPLLMYHKCPLLMHHKCPLLMHHKCFPLQATGIQTISGTGGLRVAAETLNKVLKYSTFYYSNPTWGESWQATSICRLSLLFPCLILSVSWFCLGVEDFPPL